MRCFNVDSLEAIEAMLSEQGKACDILVNTHLFSMFLTVQESQIAIKKEYRGIQCYLQSKDFVRYLLLSHNDAAFKWLALVSDEVVQEAFKTIHIEDLLPRVDRLKYLSILQDGDIAIQMPLMAMANGLGLDNTCKATVEMENFAKDVNSNIENLERHIDEQIALLTAANLNGNLNSNLDQIKETRLKLDKIKVKIQNIIFEIDNNTNIDEFQEWLQEILSHEHNNLKAIIVRPEKQDAYMRSVDEMRVCAFNHQIFDILHEKYIEVDSLFVAGFNQHFNETVCHDHRRKIESFEELKNELQENGLFDQYLKTIDQKLGLAQENASGSQRAEKIVAYLADHISLDFPEDVNSQDCILKALDIECTENVPRYLQVVLKPREDGNIDHESINQLSVACQFFIGIANIVLQEKGIIDGKINFGRILEDGNNKGLRSSLYTCVSDAIACIDSGGMTSVEEALVIWMNDNRDLLCITGNIDATIRDDIIQSFTDKFTVVIESMKKGSELDEFFILCREFGFWSVVEGLVSVDTNTVYQAIKGEPLGLMPRGNSTTGNDINQEYFLDTIKNGFEGMPGEFFLQLHRKNPNLWYALLKIERGYLLDNGQNFLMRLKQVLIDNPNIPDKNGETMLIKAIKAGDSNLVDALLDCDININAKDNNEKTALHLAIINGHSEIQSALLTHKNINVNATDNNGATALHWAVKRRDSGSVFRLLSHKNIDINAKDINGETVLHLSTDNAHSEIQSALLSHKSIKVNATDKFGRTALHREALSSHKLSVSQLLAHKNINVNAIDNNGATALYLASIGRRSENVSNLLAHKNINVNASNSHDSIALVMAASFGHLEVVNALLAHKDIDPNVANRNGNTALMMAAGNGHFAVVDTLLNCDVDVNSRDIYGQTALHCAAVNGNSECVSRLLSHQNVNVNARDKFGQTPLYWCAFSGHLDTLSALLSHENIDVNATHGNEQTALHLAVENGDLQCLDALLAHKNIDVNDSYCNELTALHLAVEKGELQCLYAFLDHKNIDVNVTYGNEQTALHLAVENEDLECVLALLNHENIDVNVRDNDGFTPLRCVVEDRLCESHQKNATLIVSALLDYGADVNAIDNNGITILEWVAYTGHTKIVALLLTHENIDINAIDNDGETALYCAASRGHLGIVTLLLEQDDIIVDIPNHNGQTALSIAESRGHIKIVELLETFQPTSAFGRELSR